MKLQNFYYCITGVVLPLSCNCNKPHVNSRAIEIAQIKKEFISQATKFIGS